MNRQIPQEIGRYKIIKQIGQGAMGVVYLAIDFRIKRNVAVKVLRLNNFKTDQNRLTACKLFLQEARITGKLNHPHITAIYDMGLHHKKPYIVMELVTGDNLKTILADTKDSFSFTEKVGILAVLARAFHYAHIHGILHRDIKPANIMILPNGNPKIMDFGIAGLHDTSTGEKVKTGLDDDITLLGTPQYMSPEHIRNESYDSRSEMFSLGILGYEWFSGKHPFVGASVKDLMRNIIKGNFPLLSNQVDLDTEICAVIDKTLSASQEDRYRNMEDFADALELSLNRLEMKSNAETTASFSYDRSQIIDRLRERYVFFADFSKEELLTIFKLSQNKRFIPGEFIIREGSTGTKMFVILSGSVSIQNDSQGQEIEIQQLGPGCCVGEMSLVDKQVRSASVVAIEPTLAIAINETVLRVTTPAICLKLYRNLAALLSEKLRIHDSKYKNLLTESKKIA